MPQNQNQTRKPSRDQLLQAAERALKRGDTDSLAEAAELFADAAATGGAQGKTTSLAAPSPGFRARGTRDWDRPPAQDQQGQGRGGNQTPTGPGAERTGHGMARGGGPRNVDGPAAYEAFIEELRPAIDAAGDKLEFTERRGWVKIVSRVNGHKIYIAKSKTAVSRIESTIDPNEIEGAAPPDRPNGRIASWIPADPDLVMQAIEFLATEQEPVRPPERGGDDTAQAQEEAPQPQMPRTRTNSRFMKSWDLQRSRR